MLSSTKEYLQALRTGKFLLFLEWPRFVAEQYKHDKRADQSADELVDLLIYEWINNDYCEADAKTLALIYKLSDYQPRLLAADLDYALTSILVAMLQCMIYQSAHAHPLLLCTKKMNRKEVSDFMRLRALDSSLIDTLTKFQQQRFANWVESISNNDVARVLLKIKPLLRLRNTVRRYLDILQKTSLEMDELRLTRISVLHCLNDYLLEQGELTAQVQEVTDSYIDKIRDLGPQKFEDEYLGEISLPLAEIVKRYVIAAGVGFFNLIKTPVFEKAAVEPALDKAIKASPL